MASKLLTKSKFMNGLQCPRLLWTVFNHPGRLPGPDIVSQYLFDQGHRVDQMAKSLFPAGVEVSGDFMGNLARTKAALLNNTSIFQAGFMAGDLYSRVDVLQPDGNDGWHIIEVKSSTEVKPEHIPDVAFQAHCCKAAGIRVSGSSVCRINKQYVKKGAIDPQGLLLIEDVSDSVSSASVGIEDSISSMFKLISSDKSPGTSLSPKCEEPRDCPLLVECRSALPDHNVLNLYYGKRAGYDLLSRGVECIKDIPANFKLSANQKIQKDCVANGLPRIDTVAIKNFLKGVTYPISYFDFETVAPAVPIYDGMRPYQKIPFQFSLVVVPAKGAEPQAFSFLAKNASDPRPALMEEMRKRFPGEGTIVVYNQTFEATILKQLGESFPDKREWLASLVTRFVDLLEPFKKFQYYHPDQHGSASIKKVLPALTGRSYKSLDIGEGETASVLYWNVTHKAAPEDERQKVYADLEKYCGLDTDGMRSIVEALGRISD